MDRNAPEVPIRGALTMIAVVLLGVIAGAGAAIGDVGEPRTAGELSDGSDAVEMYEHETEAGETIHTIELSPAAVDTPTDDGVLGVGVIPERDRVCQSVAGESYRADTAGCTTDESRAETYLADVGVERTADGGYTVE
jgi:hypothetical protein